MHGVPSNERLTDDSAEPAPVLSDLAFRMRLAVANGPSHGYAIGKDADARH